ncbi:hypothetical protein [Streptomyces sp. ID38640]|uniref:hypothetical protein n=1 Tax=Streptomyces sp. ID38640 TaxID=1265399 RepID=UPI002180C2DF|nr:hypothetical protein [Streptomyces sp. ID38640]
MAHRLPGQGGQPTDAEARLRLQVVRLKELRQKDKAELAQLRTDVEALVRVVNQLASENRQLREDPASHSVVRAFPVR